MMNPQNVPVVAILGHGIIPKKSAKGYHKERVLELYIIRKLNIFRFQIHLTAVSTFQQKCSSEHCDEHFSKMAGIW